MLGQLADFGERGETAGDHLAVAHDGAQEAMIVFWTRFVGELDDIFFPLWVAVDFFFARPGAFLSGDFYFGILCAGLIDVPDFFVDDTERSACYAVRG